jgi:coproporphyrinogen III oxidase-like Fe-S oxidoreductase
VDERYLAEFREGGFTRFRSGCSRLSRPCSRCSSAPTRGAARRRPPALRVAAGFEQVSLDLIYGTPGESDADWQVSLDAVLDLGPTHVSAYR